MLLRTPGGVVGLVLVVAVTAVAVLAEQITPLDPFASVAPQLQAPSASHLMGTDDLGRDVLTLVVHGLRTSLVVAAGVALSAGTAGVAIGAVAGFRPGVIDDLLMRGTEMVQVVPRFFLAVVVVALFGPSLSTIVGVLGFTSWTWTARVVRAETLSLRQRDFVDAARALGASDARLVLRHVLPNALPPTAVMISVVASSAILVEAGLGFVGLTDPDVVSLGSLASNAQRFLRTAWWLAAFPGVALVVTILGINLLGDALSDALNPRLRG
jgi:peptide/nickel transport system permease protein